jgi:hypothetical protein
MNAQKKGATATTVDPTQQPGQPAKQDHFTPFPIAIQAILIEGYALSKDLCEISRKLIMISNCHIQAEVA